MGYKFTYPQYATDGHHTYTHLDKDYGHMKIDEPKTPYQEMLPEEGEETTMAGQGEFADALAERLET